MSRPEKPASQRELRAALVELAKNKPQWNVVLAEEKSKLKPKPKEKTDPEAEFEVGKEQRILTDKNGDLSLEFDDFCQELAQKFVDAKNVLMSKDDLYQEARAKTIVYLRVTGYPLNVKALDHFSVSVTNALRDYRRRCARKTLRTHKRKKARDVSSQDKS